MQIQLNEWQIKEAANSKRKDRNKTKEGIRTTKYVG